VDAHAGPTVANQGESPDSLFLSLELFALGDDPPTHCGLWEQIHEFLTHGSDLRAESVEANFIVGMLTNMVKKILKTGGLDFSEVSNSILSFECFCPSGVIQTGDLGSEDVRVQLWGVHVLNKHNDPYKESPKVGYDRYIAR
jgi:hypothetical protein